VQQDSLHHIIQSFEGTHLHILGSLHLMLVLGFAMVMMMKGALRGVVMIVTFTPFSTNKLKYLLIMD